MSCIKNKTYEHRLNYLKLTTLKTRRLRDGLIQVFKIIKGFDDLDSNLFFYLNTTNTQGHPRCCY